MFEGSGSLSEEATDTSPYRRGITAELIGISRPLLKKNKKEILSDHLYRTMNGQRKIIEFKLIIVLEARFF